MLKYTTVHASRVSAGVGLTRTHHSRANAWPNYPSKIEGNRTIMHNNTAQKLATLSIVPGGPCFLSGLSPCFRASPLALLPSPLVAIIPSGRRPKRIHDGDAPNGLLPKRLRARDGVRNGRLPRPRPVHSNSNIRAPRRMRAPGPPE